MFEVPAEDAEYELQLNTMKIGGQTKTWQRSSEVTTVWKFRSHLDEGVYSQGLPVMFPRVDLPEDGLKTLAAKAGQKLVLEGRRSCGLHPRRRSRAPASPTSYDGVTWVDATTRQENGKWIAVVDHAGASGQPVSLRVQLTDSNDNTVTQTVTRAYDVR